MQFAVGYQLAGPDDEPFVELVRRFRQHVAEVYFPWGDLPSGRAALLSRRGYVDWKGQRQLEADLQAFRQMGMALDLLLNANCYGGRAVSRSLENLVGSVLEHLQQVVGGVDAVTTSSLAIARTVKRHFPSVEVRASVNMRIGSIEAMRYVAGLFDSYCVQRDLNRDLARLRDLKRWADDHGKRLSLLVNSGCLRFCPGQTFHDNLVAHELELDETVNIPDWTPHVCWHLFRDRANWPAILQATWVRPEDLHHYEELFATVKLATRMHARPGLVLRAYAEQRFHGNLLELFEPGFAPLFGGCILDNAKFPQDWFERTSNCDRLCDRCAYCVGVLNRVMTECVP